MRESETGGNRSRKGGGRKSWGTELPPGSFSPVSCSPVLGPRLPVIGALQERGKPSRWDESLINNCTAASHLDMWRMGM